MDRPACHIVYVNRNVGEDRLVRANPRGTSGPSDRKDVEAHDDQVRNDVLPLLDAFGDVHVCATGAACLSRLLQIQDDAMVDMRPTLVLIDTPHDEHIPQTQSPRSPSPLSYSQSDAAEIHTPDENIYGLDLLQKIITEVHLRGMSKLVVPVPVISFAEAAAVETPRSMTDGAVEPFTTPLGSLAANRRLVRRCLDLGAVDVIISPLSCKCITTLEICAYKAHRDASREQQALLQVRKGRKRSWVGVNEQRPYAYLREAMVSSLMNGICRFAGEDDGIVSAHLAVSSERQAAIAKAVGKWHFCAHSFTDDELLVASMLMFKHALAMPELEPWRIPTDQLISFLFACRGAYNNFVPYHNFRHVVDVLQATFNFLGHIGALPPYPSSSPATQGPKSPIASLLGPFESLALLITAIGHDVGHPGVNNGFLTTLNAPLAQLYNDRSVLESFHCAAYSQILRRYWPATFDDRGMRNMMISSILSTDMGLHFDYMKKMGDLQEKLQHSNSTDGWNGRMLEEQKILACSLLIKCADISNVARNHETALQWMHILSEEFSRQASMEAELEIKSSLFAPPKKDIVSLANAQLGFMNMFAIPLFQGVADIMPAMQYTVNELETNKGLFERMVQVEKAKESKDDPARQARLFREGTLSPRTMSLAVGNEGAGDNEGSKEVTGVTPSAILEVLRHKQMEVSVPPAHPTKEFDGTNSMAEGSKPNGGTSSFDPVKDFAESDPFHSRERGESSTDSKLSPASQQRCSETTEGSTSGPGAGDWASQATSAATGKIPMSPSTRGTSIVSRDSMERPRSSAPGLVVSSPDAKGSPSTLKEKEGTQQDEESASMGSDKKTEQDKSLKKRPSRFRMKDFPFFRRNKGSSPPSYPAADMTG